MLSREIMGWRVLAALLLFLCFATLPQLGEISDEWTESINFGEGESDSVVTEDTTPESTDGSFAAETQSAEQDENQESSADTESEPLAADASDSRNYNNEEASEPTSNELSKWVLPATQIIALTMMAIMAVALLTSTTTAILISESARFSILLALFGPLLAMVHKGERGVFTRGRILGFIEAHPGIHFSALRDALELGNGVTAHHIQILEKEGRIITWLDSKVRRFATSGIDQMRLKEIQSPATGTQIAILEILSQSENIGIKSKELREKLQTSRQLLSYHMKHLKDRDIVESIGKGKATRWKIRDKGKSLLKTSSHLSEI